MIQRRTLGLLAVTLIVGWSGPASNPACADRGGIRPIGVHVHEPGQRAIIAHDGQREVIILQTEIVADREATLVEFMPLPSKPEVSLAPEGCFAALADLVARHGMVYPGWGRGRDAESQGVKVVTEAQLGPHGVTVVEVEDVDAFLAWVHAFFRERGLDAPADEAALRETVVGYLQRGVRFFAFDVLNVEPGQKVVAPLVYSFASETLYYPLVVTNLYGGAGLVELFVALPSAFEASLHRLQDEFRDCVQPEVRPESFVAWARRLRESNVVRPTAAEMDALHEGLATLLGQGPCVFQSLRYSGELQFQRDVALQLPDRSALNAARRLFSLVQEGDTEGARKLLSTRCLVGGTVCVTDRDIGAQLERARTALRRSVWDLVDESTHVPEWSWVWADASTAGAFQEWAARERGTGWSRVVVLWLQERPTGALKRWSFLVRGENGGVRVAAIAETDVHPEGAYTLDRSQLREDVAGRVGGVWPHAVFWLEGAAAWADDLACSLTLEVGGSARLTVAFGAETAELSGTWAPRTGSLQLVLERRGTAPLHAPISMRIQAPDDGSTFFTDYGLLAPADDLWQSEPPFALPGFRGEAPASQGPRLLLRRETRPR